MLKLSRIEQFIVDNIPENFLKRAMIQYYSAGGSSINAFRKGKRYLRFMVDINNVCNLNCIMCSRGVKGKPTVENMTAEQFKLFADKCLRNAKTLQLSCAYEISIAKHAPAVLKLLPQYEVPETFITTHFNILPDNLLEAMFDAKLTSVVISIGEASEETYAKVRSPGSLKAVLDNIRRFHEYKKERGGEGPTLGANLTILKSNIHELPDFIELAADVGIDAITGRHLMVLDGLGIEDEILVDEADMVNEIIEAAGRKAAKYNIKYDVHKLRKQPKKGRDVCLYPWNHVYVSSNGDLSACPRIHKNVSFGNIFEEEFVDVFYRSEESIKLRKQCNKREHNDICNWCLSGEKEIKAVDQGF